MLTPLELIERLAALIPPLWEMLDATPDEPEPQAQPAPDYEFDQRIAR